MLLGQGGVLTKEELSKYVGQLFINSERVSEPFKRIAYIVSSLVFRNGRYEFSVRPLLDMGFNNFDIFYAVGAVLDCPKVIFITGPAAKETPEWLK